VRRQGLEQAGSGRNGQHPCSGSDA
jgi:hypothetical protein